LTINIAEGILARKSDYVDRVEPRYWEESLSIEMKPASDRLLSLYRVMLTIRRSEEQLAKMYAAGLVHGACHTYVGEEAVATGVCAHLRPGDMVFSTHRGHGHALAKGVSPGALMAELLGRETGVSHGRGGSMHLFSPEVGMMGTSGIVAPCILQAAGAAYAFKLRALDNVGVAFFGDGASNNGAFHEGINMAGAWKLPAVFVCENNLYATEIAYASVTANPEVATKAASFGIPGVAVDGNDVLAVYQAAQEAVRRARAGQGPTLIECKTYRTRAHAEGMRDAGYRTQEEINSWKARDPIAMFRKRLLEDEEASEPELQNVEREVEAGTAAAAKFAQESAYPDPATALTHVFAEDGNR
jgi:2-oxoisovalerate dehydrogenase E1 component